MKCLSCGKKIIPIKRRGGYLKIYCSNNCGQRFRDKRNYLKDPKKQMARATKWRKNNPDKHRYLQAKSSARKLPKIMLKKLIKELSAI